MPQENKINTALITGASAGIGKAITKLFIDKGFIVIAVARNITKLAKLKSEVSEPTNCHTYSCDVSEPREIKKVFAEILEEHPVIDMLVNNAGVFIPGAISQEKEGIYEQTMKTNIDSAYHISRYCLNYMPNGSYIFNMCSTASKVGYPDGGSYCISKFALLGLTKALRLELEGKIAVSAVMPGATLTNSWAGTTEPKSRFMRPEDVALSIWAAWQIRAHTVMEEILLRPHLGDF